MRDKGIILRTYKQGANMNTHKVIGKYSNQTYFVGSFDACEEFVAYEIADSFDIVEVAKEQ